MAGAVTASTSRVIGRASLALGIAAIVLPFAVWWAVFGSGETAEGLEAIGIGIAGGIFLGMAIAVGAGVSEYRRAAAGTGVAAAPASVGSKVGW